MSIGLWKTISVIASVWTLKSRLRQPITIKTTTMAMLDKVHYRHHNHRPKLGANERNNGRLGENLELF